MDLQKTLINIFLIGIPAVLAVYLIYRLFAVEQFEKSDYAAMVFLHTSLLIRTLLFGKNKKA